MTWGQAALAATETDIAGPVLLHFADHAFEALPSGALFWRAENCLLVADLHFEKLSSFARRGQLLPPYDTGLTLKKLEADLNATGATELIALGDSFHRNEGTTTLADVDRSRLARLMQRTRWIWISGNHDPAPHSLGGLCTAEVKRAGLTLTHHPRRGVPGLVAGHLHPAAHLSINGRSVRRPCFVHDHNLLILPAYGSATGTLNIMAPDAATLFDWPGLSVAMVGKDRVYPVSPKRLVAGYEGW